MEGFPDADPPHDILVMPHAFNDIGEVVAVLLRLKTQRTRYLTVYLPGKAGCDWKLLSLFYQHAPRLRIETTPTMWTSPLYIRFGYDPVAELRNGNTLTKLFSQPI